MCTTHSKSFFLLLTSETCNLDPSISSLIGTNLAKLSLYNENTNVCCKRYFMNKPRVWLSYYLCFWCYMLFAPNHDVRTVFNILLHNLTIAIEICSKLQNITLLETNSSLEKTDTSNVTFYSFSDIRKSIKQNESNKTQNCPVRLLIKSKDQAEECFFLELLLVLVPGCLATSPY